MRNAHIEKLRSEAFDVVVIGGGITGAGIALDASVRGLKVALVEKKDFASGTSSRSSKLIHGGLRYLRNLEFGLTREACLERTRLRKLAPNLVKPFPFLIPVSPKFGPPSLISVGLWMYDHFAGSSANHFERHRSISVQETLQYSPSLKPARLRGGMIYYDAITDDARLTLAVIKTAVNFGATVSNYAQVVGILKSKGKACGVTLRDLLSGAEFEVRSQWVVNASGVWAEEICTLDRGTPERMIQPSKGIHIVVPNTLFGNKNAFLIPSANDHRILFVIPWRRVTLIGTTDTVYQGGLDSPRAEQVDIDYVFDAVRATFDIQLSRQDLVSTYAGLRPLIYQGKNKPEDISRKHKIYESESGLLTIAGGKLTTYRRMACDLVNAIMKRLTQTGGCTTQEIVLSPTSHFDPSDQGNLLTTDILTHLNDTYGSEAREILRLVQNDGKLGERVLEGLPHIKAEVIYSARHEMTMTVEDFLARRTRIILEDKRNGLSCAPVVASLMGRELGWSDQEIERQLEAYSRQAQFHCAR